MLLLTCLAFLGQGDAGLPLTGLSFGFRVVGVNPGFFTHNDIRKKAGGLCGIFFEVQANVKSLLFLVDTQESGHEL